MTLHGRALTPVSPSVALQALDRAVAGCAHGGDDQGLAEALAYRATRLSVAGRQSEALDDCSRARAILGERDDSVWATLLRIEGTIAARTGDFGRAFPVLQDALDKALRHRNSLEVTSCERALGWCCSATGDPGRATSHYERAAQVLEQLGELFVAAEVRVSLGHTHRLMGAIAVSRRYFEQALALGRQVGQRRVEAFATHNLGLLSREAGEVADAIEQFGQALDLARQVDDFQLIALCLDDLAQCHRLRGPDGARSAEALARQALAESQRAGAGAIPARARTTIAAACLEQGRDADAFQEAHAAIGLMEGEGSSNSSDLVCARLAAAVAARRLNRAGWESELRRATAELASIGNTAFLRAEFAALGKDLSAMARVPAAQEMIRVLRSAIPDRPDAREQSATTPQPSRMPEVSARLLGPPDVRVNGRAPADAARSWTRRTTRELFFLLEAHRSGLTVDAISEQLWPGVADDTPGRVRSVLWTTVHRLRSALSGGDRSVAKDVVQQVSGVYRLHPDLPLKSDVAAFETLVSQAFAASGEDQRRLLRSADETYTGPYLEQVDPLWALPKREGLARAHARVLRRLIRLSMADDAPAIAAGYAERLVRAEPFSEDAVELLMRALIAAGERDRARRVYGSFARRIEKHLGELPPRGMAELVA